MLDLVEAPSGLGVHSAQLFVEALFEVFDLEAGTLQTSVVLLLLGDPLELLPVLLI